VVRVKDRFAFQSFTTMRQMVIRFWINWIAEMEITKPSKGEIRNKGIFKKPRDYYHAESVNETARETDGDSIDLQLSDRTAEQ